MNPDIPEESESTESVLRDKLAELELVFRSSVDVLIVVDPSSGLIRRASDTLSIHLGYNRQDLIGSHFSCILPDDSQKNDIPEVPDGIFVDRKIRKADGSITEMDMVASLVNEDGHSAILITLRDTAERKSDQLSMKKKNSAIDASLSAMIITDGQWAIEYANSEALSYWETDQTAMKKLGIADLLSRSSILDALRESVLKTGKWNGELECNRTDGTAFHTRATATVVSNDDGTQCFVLSFVDISRRIRLESQLREMSLHDSLTGLYNRRGFMMIGKELLESYLRRSPEVGLLFVDMDNLKAINDRLGHSMGDRSILVAAGVLSTSFRNSDILARIGGDEFVALFVDISTDSTEEALRERLTVIVDELNNQGHLLFHLSVSCGYASEKLSPTTKLSDLLSRADKQMYIDKQNRRRKFSEDRVVRIPDR